MECFEFAMEGSYWTTIANVKRKNSKKWRQLQKNF